MALLQFGILCVLAHLSSGQNWLGNAGFGGRFHGFKGSNWGPNTQDSTTITCTRGGTGFSGAFTLRRAQPRGGWGWGQRRTGVSASIRIITPAAAMGTFSLVFTERSRVDAGCTTEGLGPVIGSNPWGQQRWGHPWGSGSGMTGTSGVVTTIVFSGNDDITLELGPDRFPSGFDLEQYAGRGLALCTSVTAGADGREQCIMPSACCTLGFDNQDAVLLP